MRRRRSPRLTSRVRGRPGRRGSPRRARLATLVPTVVLNEFPSGDLDAKDVLGLIRVVAALCDADCPFRTCADPDAHEQVDQKLVEPDRDGPDARSSQRERLLPDVSVRPPKRVDETRGDDVNRAFRIDEPVGRSL